MPRLLHHAPLAFVVLIGIKLAVFGHGIAKGLEGCASERPAQCPGGR